MNDLSPINLVEDEETGDRFLIYTDAKGIHLDIRYSQETLWMTQEQMARLFGRDVSVVSRHISNALAENELDAESNLQKMQIARSDKPVTLYSLDMVISVGYRVSSKQGTLFRRWATGVLVQFAKGGFVVDRQRLKQSGSSDRVSELRDIIRDLRSDEANLYRELRKICALCQDYQQNSEAALEFFKRTQAKLLFAVVSQTPAEIIDARADADKPDMGLKTWSNAEIRKADALVSKNYLVEAEVKELNRLTTILLDIFEDQADLGHLVVMADAADLLDRQLKSLGRVVLDHGGLIKAEKAKAKAEAEYVRFTAARKLKRLQAGDEAIARLIAEAKILKKR